MPVTVTNLGARRVGSSSEQSPTAFPSCPDRMHVDPGHYKAGDTWGDDQKRIPRGHCVLIFGQNDGSKFTVAEVSTNREHLCRLADEKNVAWFRHNCTGDAYWVLEDHRTEPRVIRSAVDVDHSRLLSGTDRFSLPVVVAPAPAVVVPVSDVGDVPVPVASVPNIWQISAPTTQVEPAPAAVAVVSREAAPPLAEVIRQSFEPVAPEEGVGQSVVAPVRQQPVTSTQRLAQEVRNRNFAGLPPRRAVPAAEQRQNTG